MATTVERQGGTERGGHGPGELQAGPKLRPLGREHGATNAPSDLPALEWEEILRHNRPGDLWVVFGNGVYDVSEWAHHHPGGPEALLDTIGQNATKAFGQAGHSKEAFSLAQSFKIGILAKGSKPPSRRERRALRDAPEGDGSANGSANGKASAGPPLTQALRRFVHDRPAAPSHTPADVQSEIPLEIPYAVRWLAPKGERFANFDILNDNDTQLEYYRRFGHIYAVGIPTKKWRLVVVSDPELLDEVAGDEEQFGKTTKDINFFDQLAGSRGAGISVAPDSEYYDRVRRIMLPWYAPAHQKTQFDRMKACAAELLKAWEALPAGETLDAKTWMTRYTLEISGLGACNYKFGLLSGGEPNPFGDAVPKSTQQSIARIVEPLPDVALPGTAKGKRKRDYEQGNQLLFDTADALVKGRLNTCPAGEQTDLLSRLVSEPDPDTGERLDSGTIRDQLLMHLSNGFNGPSITLSWLIGVLATHPDVEAKLIAEIDGITAGDPAYELQYTDLMAMPYMTQVIKETLRVYPPMPITIRRSLKDGLLGRYRIRRDDIILVGALAAHRDPRYWGRHAGRFDPSHFSPEKVLERPRHAFIPFSVGVRQCMAQEVTFMMLRVGLFHILNRYRLRPAPGTKVVKNTAATTKPVSLPVRLVEREGKEARQAAVEDARAARKASADDGAAAAAGGSRDWDRPSEIPETSTYRHLVIAYGSNFGTNRDLAEQFAERSRLYGFTSEVIPLNSLPDLTARAQPWLLIVFTATYTSNPPSNAIAAKSWLEKQSPGDEHWKHCRYLVWGLGNSQWNAFLAFPRYMHQRLGELGATPVADLAYGDVGSPVWEDVHAGWNDGTWQALIELSGAQPSEAAAARVAAERAAEEALTETDSDSAMVLSLDGQIVAPTVMTNAVGLTPMAVTVTELRMLQAPESAAQTRHLEVSLPPGCEYTAGDHLGVCPENEEALVERLAARLGAGLEGVFSVPKSMKVRAVPKGVPLQVRNVLTNLIDISSRPTPQLVDLLLEHVEEPEEGSRLGAIREVLVAPDGPPTPLHETIERGGYNTVTLMEEFASVKLNIFEFLQVAQPLKPRYYSTSSSPRIHGSEVAHVSVGRSGWKVPGMSDREFHGMSSHWVHTRRVGDRMNVFIDRAEGFHMQEDVTRPMIFVSAGTGYAPMRAFLWERLAMKRDGTPMGPAALFNGIRSSKLDYIYEDEIRMFAHEGVLDELHVAMSREVPGVRDYVQDRLLGQADLVCRYMQDGGFIYICGSERMRDDVRKACVTCVERAGGRSPEEAEAYLQAMEAEQRYRPDVWG